MEKFIVDRKPANNIMVLLKHQIQLSKFGDLTDFIKQFINQVASHPATNYKEDFRGYTEWKVLKKEEWGKRANSK